MQKIAKNNGQVRIIGGKWRSRKIQFPAVEGLRPTPDRVRETVFNWLTSFIQGAHCLDLFAGSGALGFEALSRGAQSLLMIDQSATVSAHLREQANLLGADDADVQCTALPNALLATSNKRFDIVFLDPPFHQQLIEPSCRYLEHHGWLAENALIYIEGESKLTDLPVPANWKISRSKKAGQVGYHLFARSSF